MVIIDNIEWCSYVDAFKRKLARSVFSSVRLSSPCSHYFAIEKGRQSLIMLYVPIHERICNYCNIGAIEGEFHFLFSCSKCSHSRAIFKRN